MKITVRDSTSGDIPALCGIDQVVAIEHSRKQQIQDWVNSGQAIVAENSDKVVGYAAMNYHFFNCGFIAMLVVEKEWRRMGIATALINQLEILCKTDKLFTSTNSSNKPMQALLERLSYEASGTVTNLDDGDPELFYFKNLKKQRFN